MPRSFNLSRAGAIYHYRQQIRLPDGKPFRLKLSLKIACPRRARLMAAALTLQSEKLTAWMNDEADFLTAEQRIAIYRAQMARERDRLETMHAKVMLGDEIETAPLAQSLAIRLDAAEIAGSDAIITGHEEDFLAAQFDPDDEEGLVLVMAWSDLQEAFPDPDLTKVADERLRALSLSATPLRRAVARKLVGQARVAAVREFRRALTEPNSLFGDVPLVSEPTAQVSCEPSTSAIAGRGVTNSDNEWATLTPTQAADKYIAMNPKTGGHDGAARSKGRSWDAKTREQFKLPALLLEQVMDGRPLAAVTEVDLRKLDSYFQKVHGPSFRKSPTQREMRIQAIAEEVATRVRNGKLSPKDLGLGIGTTNRHWSFLRALTTWFGKRYALPVLDYKAFIIADDRDPRKLRDGYTVNEARQLFALPPWTGCKSASQRFASGDLIVHDAGYWVPILLWYTAMRRDEVCGLEIADVAFDAIPHLFVRENNVRGLKTSSSERTIPISSELIRLGFLNYVQALRDDGEQLVFPELAPESGKGTLGDAYYKTWWVKLRARLPFIEPGQATHSFRHSALTEMKAAGIDVEVRADVAGQKVPGETGGRYSKATELNRMLIGIEAIPKVTDGVKPTPIRLRPAGLRKPRKARRTSGAP